MLTETLTLVTIAAVTAVVTYVAGVIFELIDLWGHGKLPEIYHAPMSDTDIEKIEETKELMQQCFGKDISECIRKASNKERISLMTDFAECLAIQYGLDIDVDVTVSNLSNCGSYDWKEKKAVFNIALLMIDGSSSHFDYCVQETLDTIVHELRHAVQHQAIQQKGFWNIDDERRNAWALNMSPNNYIRGDVDMRGYANQPLEKDAVTFAAMVMEGVFGV